MKVSGPFIEYNCHACGVLVSQKVPMDARKIRDRMDEVRENNETACCASCWQPPADKA